jgi:Bacterial lectin/WW domain
MDLDNNLEANPLFGMPTSSSPPPDWTMYHTDDGTPYWYNSTTEESVWVDPTAAAAISSSSDSSSDSDSDNDSDANNCYSHNDAARPGEPSHSNTMLIPQHKHLSVPNGGDDYYVNTAHRISADWKQYDVGPAECEEKRLSDAHQVSPPLPMRPAAAKQSPVVIADSEKPLSASSPSHSPEWVKYYDDSGIPYFYNAVTSESRWEPPPGFIDNGDYRDEAYLLETTAMDTTGTGDLYFGSIDDDDQHTSTKHMPLQTSSSMEGVELAPIGVSSPSSSPPSSSPALTDKSESPQHNASEKCRCCRRHPRCQRFWSDTRVRWITLVLSLGLLAYLIYLIWAIIMLFKIADSGTSIDRLEIPNLCALSVPFFTTINITNPSSLGITLRNAHITVQRVGYTEPLGSFAFAPVFGDGSAYLPPGESIMTIDTTFHGKTVGAIGDMLSLMLSQQVNVPTAWYFSFDIETNALGFPLSRQVQDSIIIFFNDERPETADKRVALENSGARPPVPDPHLRDVHMLKDGRDRGAQLLPSDLAALTSWTLYTPQPRFNINVPRVHVRTALDNAEIAEADVSAFNWTWGGDTNVDVDIFDVSNPTVMSSLQRLANHFSTNTTFKLQLLGAERTANITGTSACMIQQALDAMPTAKLTVIPQPYKTCTLSGCTINAQASNNPNDQTPTSSSSSSSSMVELQHATVSNVTRVDFTRIAASGQIYVNTSFVLWGSFPDIYFNLHSFDDTLLYVELHAFEIEYGKRVLDIQVTVHGENENAIWDRMRDGKSIDEMALILQGRPNMNSTLSDILVGYVYNISHSMASEAPAVPAMQATDASASVIDSPTNSVAIRLDYTASEMLAVLEIGTKSFSPAYNIAIPPIDIESRVRLQNGGVGSDMPAWRFSMDALQFGPSAAEIPFYTGVFTVSRQDGNTLGKATRQFLDTDIVSTRTITNTASSTPVAELLHVDVNIRLNRSIVFGLVPSPSPVSAFVSSRAPSAASDLSLELGPFVLDTIQLERWHRREFAGFSHTVGFNFTLDYVGDVHIYGRLPHTSASLSFSGAPNLFSLSIVGRNYHRTQQSSRSFDITLLIGIASEAGAVDVATRIDNARSRVLAYAQGNTQPNAAGVFEEFLTGYNMSFELVSDNDVAEAAANPSSSSSSFKTSARSLQPLFLTVQSSTTTLQGTTSMVLPNVSLPFTVNIGAFNVDFHFVPQASDPIFSAPYKLFNFSSDSLRWCQTGCSNVLYAFANMVHSDGGDKAAIIVNNYLKQTTATWFHATGLVGTASVDIEVIGNPPNASQTISNVANGIANNFHGETVVAANLTRNYAFNSLHVIGPTAESDAIILPCIVPGVFCPYNKTQLTGNGIRMLMNMSVENPLPIDVVVTVPDFAFDLDCCIHEPLVDMKIESLTFDTRKPFIMAGVDIVYRDVGLLFDAVREITESNNNFNIRLHGDPNSNLVSNLFSRYENVLTIDADGSSVSPVVDVVSSSIVKLSRLSNQFKQQQQAPPSEPSDSASVAVELSAANALSYSLSATTSNSASFQFDAVFDMTFSFPVRMGQVVFKAQYDSIDFAQIDMNVAFEPGMNSISFLGTIFGQPVLTSRCSGATIPDKRFCIANEVVSRIIAREEFPLGTSVDISGTFTNVYGEQVTVLLNSVVFQEDPDLPPEFQRYSSLGLLHDFNANVLSSVFNMISSIFSSQVDLDLNFVLKNIFEFTIELTEVQLDLVMKDYDGVPDYWYLELFSMAPLAPDLNFLIADDAKKTLSNFVVVPGQTGNFDIDIPVQWSTLPEGISRLYDDYNEKNRLCLNTRGYARLQLQAPGDEPLMYTQEFDVKDMTIVGDYDCATPSDCQPSLSTLFSYGFSPSNAAQWSLRADAQWISSNSVIRLTNDDIQTGAAWHKQRVEIVNSWEIEFEFRINTASWAVGNADGPRLNIQNNGLTVYEDPSTGTAGSSIANSISVLFDSYLVNEIYVYDFKTVKATQQPSIEFDDGGWHTARVVYNSNTKKLSVYLDNVFQCIADIAMEQQFTDKAYIGVTGTTGGYYFSEVDVKSFTFKEKTVVPTLLENGRIRGRVNQVGTYTILARDSCDLPIRTGGAVFTSTLTRSGVTTATSIVDNDDGTYTVSFTVSDAGTYNVYTSYSSVASIGTINVEL